MASPYEDYLASLNPLGGPGLNPGMGLMTPEQAGLAGMFKPPVGVGAVPGLSAAVAPVGGLLEEKVPAEGLPDLLLQMQIDKYKNFSDLGQHGIPLTQGSAGAGYDPSKVVQAVKDLVLGGLGKSPVGSAGVFGGRLSQDTGAVDRLFKAAAMEREGATPNQIWSQTGTWTGPGGFRRYEIPDTASNLTGSAERAIMKAGPGGKVTAPLGEILNHPAAYEAYPGLPNMTTMVGLNPYSRGGYFVHGDLPRGQVRISSTGMDVGGPEGIHGILLHEINHGIQGIEGFPSGANLDVAGQEGQNFLNKINKQISDLGSDHWMLTREANPLDASDMARIAAQIERLKSIRDQFQMHFDPYQYYKRSAGEVESRGVQARMTLPQHLLNAIPPEHTMGLDVPVPQRWISYANR
jgi:hypothetical protein